MPRLHHGDCIEVMRAMPEASVDAIVTDPPYGLGFMGKAWDDLPPGEDWARECLRVLRPGGHLMAFGGTRTWHRLAVAIEDAGFEIRDSIAWMHGQGFPKGKASLKPAHEPIVVARKKPTAPRAGRLNIDACRVEHGGNIANAKGGGQGAGYEAHDKPSRIYGENLGGIVAEPHPAGRWPANVILDESQAAALDEQAPRVGGNSVGADPAEYAHKNNVYGEFSAVRPFNHDTSKGGASRFFYVAKAPKRERPNVDGIAHPTVKPLALMRWLVRLVTPEGGIVLDPFAGSGTTIEAALLEGFDVIGIEREADYLPLIQLRIDRTEEEPCLSA